MFKFNEGSDERFLREDAGGDLLELVETNPLYVKFKRVTLMSANGPALNMAQVRERFPQYTDVNYNDFVTFLNVQACVDRLVEKFQDPKVKSCSLSNMFGDFVAEVIGHGAYDTRRAIEVAGFRAAGYASDSLIRRATVKKSASDIGKPTATHLRRARGLIAKELLKAVAAKLDLTKLSCRLTKNTDQDTIASLAKTVGIDFNQLTVENTINFHWIAEYKYDPDEVLTPYKEMGQIPVIPWALKEVFIGYGVKCSKEQLDYLTTNLTKWWNNVQLINSNKETQ